VVVLGSTGSIGRQALEVIAANPGRFEVLALAAGRDERALAEQVAATGARRHGLGAAAAAELATLDEADVVLNAVVGAAGLPASVAALEAGKTLALANKESLVAGGEVCVGAASRSGAAIVPVDSEHAALAQCLEGRDPATVARVVLTASGGPFRRRDDLSGVTPGDALAHPTWSMGPKITIDSATMMNKGLEVIEAHWLFHLDYDRITTLVHPQSIVHGIVEFVDDSALLQAAPTDMKIPIQSALSHPLRLVGAGKPVDLAGVGTLEFEEVDHERFPAVGLAYEAGRRGGSFAAVLNAANEVAVNSFLAGRTTFAGITELIGAVLDDHDGHECDSLEAVLEADQWARRRAEERLAKSAATIGGIVA
jgi:1-deoxy-D-xylulose-5-phosphate reductoisomerase